LIGTTLGLDPKTRGRRLAGGSALARALDAMVDRIAHEVQQRLEQHLHDGLVRFRVVALDDELHGLSQVRGHLADEARKALQYGT
jgi:hypothetical protein